MDLSGGRNHVGGFMGREKHVAGFMGGMGFWWIDGG